MFCDEDINVGNYFPFVDKLQNTIGSMKGHVIRTCETHDCESNRYFNGYNYRWYLKLKWQVFHARIAKRKKLWVHVLSQSISQCHQGLHFVLFKVYFNKWLCKGFIVHTFLTIWCSHGWHFIKKVLKLLLLITGLHC